VLDPIMRSIKLKRVMIDGGSALNLIFAKTLDDMRIPRSELIPNGAPFHGIVPGASSVPLGHITLPVTFGTRENFRTENLTFEVADFEMAYHAILGRPALAKFMAVPHYTYMVLKMPGPRGVITLHGDIKQSFVCEHENHSLAQSLQATAELDKIRLDANSLRDTGEVPAKKSAKASIKPDDDTIKIPLDPSDSSKTALIGTGLGEK